MSALTTTAPEPFTRRELLAPLLYLAAALLLFWPALERGVFLFGTDTIHQKYLFYQLGWDSIRETGRLPLWNPYVFGGIPYLGSFALCPFFPTTWPMGLLAFPLAFTLHYLLSNALAGCGGWAGLRLLGVGRFGAAAGGLFFQLTGHFATLVYPGHIGKYPAIACFPLVIGGIAWAIRRKRAAGFVLAGIGIAGQILASHLQIAYYTVGVCLLYGAWALATQPECRGWRAPRRLAGGYTLMLGVAAGLSGIFLLPALETSARSNRAGGVAYADAIQSSYPPSEIGEWLLPLYTGDSLPRQERAGAVGRHGRYFGKWGERLVSDYVGIGVVLLAVLGVAAGRGRDRWFWLAVAAAALVVSFGGNTPIYKWLYHVAPGFNRFRSPATVMFLISFAVVYLAAQGLDGLVRRETLTPRLRRVVWSLLLASLIVFLLAALAGYAHLERLREETLRSQLFWRSLLRTGLFGALSATMLLVWFKLRAEAAGRHAGVALLGAFCFVAALDLYLVDRQFVIADSLPRFQAALTRYQPLADGLRLTRPDERPYRTIDIERPESNRLMMSRLPGLDGYHPVSYRRYDELRRAGLYDPTIGRLLGLRYLLSPDPRAKQLQDFEPDGRIPGLYVRRGGTRYAWFPERVTPAPAGELLERTLALKDVYREAPIEAPAEADAELREFDSAAACRATVIEYDFNRVRLRYRADKARPIVVSEYAAPGWQAILDGARELPIETADYLLRMVEVEAGEHELEFRYEPDSYRTGGFVTLLTLAGLAGWGLFRRRPARGRNPRTE